MMRHMINNLIFIPFDKHNSYMSRTHTWLADDKAWGEGDAGESLFAEVHPTLIEHSVYQMMLITLVLMCDPLLSQFY